MRTFAPAQNTQHLPGPSGPSRPAPVTLGLDRRVPSFLPEQRLPGPHAGFTATTALPYGHDFSRLSILPSTIQTKLAISEPGDAGEQEADRLADQVMGGALAAAHPSSAAAGHTGAGMALEPADQQFFEARFNHNFADVRVYADRAAHESTRSLGARAYTVGNSISFASGEYRPGTPAGRHLLAHELTHVIQQRHMPASNSMLVQRQPDSGKQPPPPKQKSLKEQGVGLDDPIFDKTAQMIDEVLLRNTRLAPYIGDKLKAGLRIAEKGKFVQELSDANFDGAYRKAYDQDASRTVPTYIVGFYDPKKSEVHVRPDARFGTALHEAVHRLASATLYNYYLPTAMKISSNLGEILKEGVTAFFTDCILKDEGLNNYNDGYSDVKKKASGLVTALGSDGFDLLAKFNFKGGAIVEIGEKLGLSRQQYADLKGGAQEEVLKRINKQL